MITEEQYRIALNRPNVTGNELGYIEQVFKSRHFAGDGPFTRKCHEWIERLGGNSKALLTHSCTAALEMTALLLDIAPGDEVIMPSYTFASTANAFVLRGAVPVFIDIRADTLNLDERLIERAITSRTRAIVPVHYAGVSCEMDEILAIARRNDICVIEDAAQGVGSTYYGRPLGSMGRFGAFSFHETKNLISGEGGALLVNDDLELAARAETIREKGTDRSKFFRGEVDKYTWQEAGSSYLPSEIVAAFLWAQLERANKTNAARMTVWERYHHELSEFESAGKLRRPIIPTECIHNAHMYYVILPSKAVREKVMLSFRDNGVEATFHYVPLHSTPAGKRFSRADGALTVTDDYWERLIRLPLSPTLLPEQQSRILDILIAAL